MEIIVTAVLPNVVLNRCVTNALDYSLRRQGPNKVRTWPGFTGTRLDGYSPQTQPQKLASTLVFSPQISRVLCVLVGREFSQGASLNGMPSYWIRQVRHANECITPAVALLFIFGCVVGTIDETHQLSWLAVSLANSSSVLSLRIYTIIYIYFTLFYLNFFLFIKYYSFFHLCIHLFIIYSFNMWKTGQSRFHRRPRNHACNDGYL